MNINWSNSNAYFVLGVLLLGGALFYDFWRKLYGRKVRKLTRSPSSSVNRYKGSSGHEVVFVLGGPGSGKSTICKKLAAMSGNHFVHLSVGELLRQKQQTQSKLGTMIKHCIEQGNLVPPEVVVTIIRQAISNIGPQKLILLDGFPRDYDNIRVWEEDMQNFASVEFTLVLQCPDHVLIERLLQRSRSDDTMETIQARLRIYKAKTIPIIEHFRSLGLVRDVDSNHAVDETVALASAYFADYTAKTYM